MLRCSRALAKNNGTVTTEFCEGAWLLEQAPQGSLPEVKKCLDNSCRHMGFLGCAGPGVGFMLTLVSPFSSGYSVIIFAQPQMKAAQRSWSTQRGSCVLRWHSPGHFQNPSMLYHPKKPSVPAPGWTWLLESAAEPEGRGSVALWVWAPHREHEGSMWDHMGSTWGTWILCNTSPRSVRRPLQRDKGWRRRGRGWRGGKAKWR